MSKWNLLKWGWCGWPVMWWAVQLAVKAPVALLGLAVVPLLYKHKNTPLDELPWWSTPWANPEDWTGGHKGYTDSLPDWWKTRMAGENPRWAFYKYHAIRNPADGLRNYEWLNLKINEKKVYYWTPQYMDHYDPWYDRTPGVRGYVAGQNIWWGIKVQWIRKKSYSEFKWGFRVEPRDAHHPLDADSTRRVYGASMATKFILNREL